VELRLEARIESRLKKGRKKSAEWFGHQTNYLAVNAPSRWNGIWKMHVKQTSRSEGKDYKQY